MEKEVTAHKGQNESWPLAIFRPILASNFTLISYIFCAFLLEQLKNGAIINKTANQFRIFILYSVT